MAVALDASSPVRFSANGALTLTATSASFTPPANSFLTACVQINTNGSAGQEPTFNLTTAGLTWTEQGRRGNSETGLGGFSAIFTCPQVASAARQLQIQWSAGAGNGTAADNQINCKIDVWTGVDIAGTPVDTVTAANEGTSTTNNLTVGATITPGADGVLVVSDTEWQANGVLTSSDLNLGFSTDDLPTKCSYASGSKAVTNGVAVGFNMNAGGAGTANHKWVAVVLRAAAGGGTTVGLTGVSATGATGTVAPTPSVALAGASGTSAAGTEGPATTIPLVGQAGTSARGSVAPAASIALTGNEATGDTGEVAAGDVTLGLTGHAATSAVGSVLGYRGTVIGFTQLGRLTGVSGSTAALTGVTGTSAIGTTASSGGDVTAILSGQQMVVSAGTVSAPRALSGASATATRGSIATANITVGLTGVSATGARGSVAAVVGTLTLSGVSADDPPGARDVLFTWNADPTPGVTNYHVELGTAPGLADAYDLNVGSLATSYTAIGIANGSYYSRIRSYAGAVPGLASTDVLIVVSGRLGLLAPSATIALSGIGVLGLVGPVAAQSDAAAALGGVAATGNLGALAAQAENPVTVAAVGVSATVSRGSTVSTSAHTPTGQSLVHGTGFTTVSIVVGLTGAPATSTAGVVGVGVGTDVTVSLTGVVATAHAGTAAPTTILGVAGQQVALLEGALVGGLSLIGFDLAEALGQVGPIVAVDLHGLAVLSATIGGVAGSSPFIQAVAVTDGGLKVPRVLAESIY